MTLLPFISTIAILLGLAGVVPQIAAMVRRRSAAGQSPLGWSLGVTVNVLMAYVNLIGYGAKALAIGNACGALLCMAALACALRLPRAAVTPPAQAARPDPLDMSTGDLSEMLTVLAQERERREERRRSEGPSEHEHELALA